MSDKERALALLKTVYSENVIAFRPELARAVGGIEPAIFLQQVIHWTQKSGDGWVFRTQKELADETALGRYAQEKARAALRSAGVLVEERRGVPAQLYYRVDWEDAALDEVQSLLCAPDSDYERP